MKYSTKDAEILRPLLKKKSEYARRSENRENIALWTAANDLKMTKPPIYINELPWHELNKDGMLDPRAEDPFLADIERKLRRELYAFEHLCGNMVVSEELECPIAWSSTQFGITEDVDIKKTDDANNIVSRHFHIQISGEEDIEKIKTPVVTVDEEETERRYQLLCRIADGIMPVVKTGLKGKWFTPWDNLIRWTGVQEALTDLICDPEYIEKLVARFVEASLAELEQFRKLGLWSSNNDNTRVGSGGYGYTTGLPAKRAGDNCNVPTQSLWGCGNAQVFSEVSPRMHWDFSLKYECKWLENFGMNYYGCCEPLHGKMEILSKIPNLRKISASPWAKIEQMAPLARGKYVLSCKPNPAVFATDTYDEAYAEKQIYDILEKSDGCSIELIAKDISTCRYEPERLWRWNEMALNILDREFHG